MNRRHPEDAGMVQDTNPNDADDVEDKRNNEQHYLPAAVTGAQR